MRAVVWRYSVTRTRNTDWLFKCNVIPEWKQSC
jgi:hypothetical protein